MKLTSDKEVHGTSDPNSGRPFELELPGGVRPRVLRSTFVSSSTIHANVSRACVHKRVLERFTRELIGSEFLHCVRMKSSSFLRMRFVYQDSNRSQPRRREAMEVVPISRFCAQYGTAIEGREYPQVRVTDAVQVVGG